MKPLTRRRHTVGAENLAPLVRPRTVSAQGNEMTKKTKIMLIFSHIAVLSIGFVVGLYSSFTKDAKEVMRMSSQAAMISHYGLLVDTQRNEGDRDAYKKALITYLGVLDETFKHPTALFCLFRRIRPKKLT